MNERNRIKSKILKYNTNRWWGDDFDVRFFLISKIKKLQNKKILDLGGGIGIISSELKKSNFCINLDIEREDLKKCKVSFNKSIHVIEGSMLKIPLKEDSLDYVICANILEVAKSIDIKNNHIVKGDIVIYPSLKNILLEINRILKPKGVLLITTPNNSYYESSKLTYDELVYHLNRNFKNFSVNFYNTFPRLSKKYKKLNLANIVPKILSKIKNPDSIIQLLIKENTVKNKNSVSFYVEAVKKE